MFTRQISANSQIKSRRKKFPFLRSSAKLTLLHWVLYQLTMAMSKISYRLSNNISSDNTEKKIKSFLLHMLLLISSLAFNREISLKYREIWVTVR